MTVGIGTRCGFISIRHSSTMSSFGELFSYLLRVPLHLGVGGSDQATPRDLSRRERLAYYLHVPPAGSACYRQDLGLQLHVKALSPVCVSVCQTASHSDNN